MFAQPMMMAPAPWQMCSLLDGACGPLSVLVVEYKVACSPNARALTPHTRALHPGAQAPTTLTSS